MTLPLHSSQPAALQPTGSSVRCWPGASAMTLTQGGSAKGTALRHCAIVPCMQGTFQVPLIDADLLHVGACKQGCHACL